MNIEVVQTITMIAILTWAFTVCVSSCVGLNLLARQDKQNDTLAGGWLLALSSASLLIGGLFVLGLVSNFAK